MLQRTEELRLWKWESAGAEQRDSVGIQGRVAKNLHICGPVTPPSLCCSGSHCCKARQPLPGNRPPLVPSNACDSNPDKSALDLLSPTPSLTETLKEGWGGGAQFSPSLNQTALYLGSAA